MIPNENGRNPSITNFFKPISREVTKNQKSDDKFHCEKYTSRTADNKNILTDQVYSTCNSRIKPASEHYNTESAVSRSSKSYKAKVYEPSVLHEQHHTTYHSDVGTSDSEDSTVALNQCGQHNTKNLSCLPQMQSSAANSLLTGSDTAYWLNHIYNTSGLKGQVASNCSSKHQGAGGTTAADSTTAHKSEGENRRETKGEVQLENVTRNLFSKDDVEVDLLDNFQNKNEKEPKSVSKDFGSNCIKKCGKIVFGEDSGKVSVNRDDTDFQNTKRADDGNNKVLTISFKEWISSCQATETGNSRSNIESDSKCMSHTSEDKISSIGSTSNEIDTEKEKPEDSNEENLKQQPLKFSGIAKYFKPVSKSEKPNDRLSSSFKVKAEIHLQPENQGKHFSPVGDHDKSVLTAKRTGIHKRGECHRKNKKVSNVVIDDELDFIIEEPCGHIWKCLDHVDAAEGNDSEKHVELSSDTSTPNSNKVILPTKSCKSDLGKTTVMNQKEKNHSDEVLPSKLKYRCEKSNCAKKQMQVENTKLVKSTALKKSEKNLISTVETKEEEDTDDIEIISPSVKHQPDKVVGKQSKQMVLSFSATGMKLKSPEKGKDIEEINLSSPVHGDFEDSSEISMDVQTNDIESVRNKEETTDRNSIVNKSKSKCIGTAIVQNEVAVTKTKIGRLPVNEVDCSKSAFDVKAKSSSKTTLKQKTKPRNKKKFNSSMSDFEADTNKDRKVPKWKLKQRETKNAESSEDSGRSGMELQKVSKIKCKVQNGKVQI